MKTKFLLSLVTVALSVGAVGAYATLTRAGTAAPGPTMSPSATAIAPPDTESAGRVNIPALAANLEFLGDKPALSGHPLLIEFWATWCPPCRASIAHLNTLNKKYHDRGLEIVGISGEDKAVVERFRKSTAMDYNVALDPEQALAGQFQVQAIPQAWLFDKDGRVIWSGHPMQLDEQTIARALLNQPKT